MKTYWGMEIYLHAFLTSALDGGEWWASRPVRFTPKKRALGTHWIGGWADPSAGLDAVVKRKIPSPCRDSKPRLFRSQPSAIPLSYSGSFCWSLVQRFVRHFFGGEDLLAPFQHPSWKTIPCRLPATAYSIYSQPPSISGGRLHHPQPEDPPCRRDRGPHNVVFFNRTS
jgi:hypothetical protein